MDNFTFRDFSNLLENEQQLLDSFSTTLEQPGISVVNKIIAYNKSVSVKNLTSVEPMIIVLN